MSQKCNKRQGKVKVKSKLGLIAMLDNLRFVICQLLSLDAALPDPKTLKFGMEKL